MNKDTSITENEFEIINIIGDGFRASQRQLSSHTGLSLGMTNLLLRRLVTKGHLRIKQLNRKKVEYLLTPRGLSEKAKKTYHYTLKTINSLMLLKAQIHQIYRHYRNGGRTQFIILGNGDLQDLLELAARNLEGPRVQLTRVEQLADVPSFENAVIFHGEEMQMSAPQGVVAVNIVEALSKVGTPAVVRGKNAVQPEPVGEKVGV